MSSRSQYDQLQNLELNLFNSTSDVTPCVIRQDYNSEIFPDSQNALYELAITRFRIPISTMELMLIADNTEHYIQIEADVVHTILR